MRWFGYPRGRRTAAGSARRGRERRRGARGDAAVLGDGGLYIARARTLRERTAVLVAPARVLAPRLLATRPGARWPHSCKISYILKSNFEIGPIFKFITKSVYFYCKIGSICDESGLFLQ
jgi:hypothetical protein